MAAPHQLSRWLASSSPAWANDSVARALASDRARRLLGAGAIGEMLVDKLPFVPDRIEPGSLVGRALTGALAGGALAHLQGARALPGAVAGSVGAVLGAFAGFHARRSLVRTWGVPDPLVAVLEDAVSVATARAALRGARPIRGNRPGATP